jgi:hypothetical protein
MSSSCLASFFFIENRKRLTLHAGRALLHQREPYRQFELVPAMAVNAVIRIVNSTAKRRI